MVDNETLPGLDSLPEAQVDNTPEKQPELAESTPEKQPNEPIPSKSYVKEDNLRILRERLEQERQQREKMEQRLAQIENSNKPRVESEPEDWDLGVKDDDIVEGKHISKINKQVHALRKSLAEEQKLRMEMQKQTEENILMASIKSSFPDIEKVVNESTLAELERVDPDLVELIKSSTSLKSKAAIAYRAIKDKGIYIEDTFASDREKVQKNAVKPKPTNSVGGSPLSQADMYANGLTPELKARLNKEMEDARKLR